MKEKKSQKKLQKKSLKTLPIALILLIMVVLIISFIASQMHKSNTAMTPEKTRTEAYNQVQSGEDAVDGTSAVKFDAYFTNTEGNNIRGTCNEIGKDANLYMKLSLVQEGQLQDATITINSDNFYFNTAILKDDAISQSYISSNTKTIKLNNISSSAAGYNKTITGTVRSGDYSSETTKAAAIGNDTNKYSSNKNTITITGTFVDSGGTPHSFTKTTEPFFVDWYGETDIGFDKDVQKQVISNWDSIKTDDGGMKLTFDVTTTESKNQLIMSGSYIRGTMPELNGYKPTSVKISGTNVTYNYNAQTGEFTAQSVATVDENGIVTNNAYSYQNSYTRYTNFSFTVIYPKETYESFGYEEARNFELKFTIFGRNEGFNNPNTSDGFKNPYVSNEDSSVVAINYSSGTAKDYKFYIGVGSYVYNPYQSYVVSKEKPLRVYNGISLEEPDDTYTISWQIQTSTNNSAKSVTIKEKPDGDKTKGNYIETTSGEQIQMSEFLSNKGVYFGGLDNSLGTDGWLKIYNDETNELIETFTSSNWNTYTSSNPYICENKVKYIRVETSAMNADSNLYVYNIKLVDDTYITEHYTREEFDEFSYIYNSPSAVLVKPDGGKQPFSGAIGSMYVAPTSVANISINADTLSTKGTANNEKITISTETNTNNGQGWENGIFLVKLPSEIVNAEINSVTINNSRVQISSYDLYQENGSYFIKIITENTVASLYDIVIDCNLTPDPRIPQRQPEIELYAVNEVAADYYYPGPDTYDIDGDSNVAEQINYKTATLTLQPEVGLNTTEYASNYGQGDKLTFAPGVVQTSKGPKTATITVTATNNYGSDLSKIKFQGVIPFEGNQYVITGNDLGSTFSTQMVEGGITPVTSGIGTHATYYYSTQARPTNDENSKANGWTLAENVQDWSQIKTYLIVLDDSYTLSLGETIEFSYDVIIPQDVVADTYSYAENAVYYSVQAASGGEYSTSSVGSEKLGFKIIPKQFDLEITKYQKDKDKKLQGIGFTLTEEGQSTSKYEYTDANGVITFTGLLEGKNYTLKETRTTDDYVLSTEEIKFYTYAEVGSDGTENLYIVPERGNNTKLEETYETVKTSNVVKADEESGEDYRVQLEIENEVKAKLAINVTDKANNNPMQNVKFTLTGGDFNNKILTTGVNGNIALSGLYLDQEYTLTETKSTGYYVLQQPIKFTLTNNNGTIEVTNYTDGNGTIATPTIETNDEIPTVKFNMQIEKIPTYSLQITKYAKGEKDESTGEDKVLQGAQYKIYGDGISDEGRVYTTDENGVITINDLYEYVDGKYITGEYSITEIYAPEGYAVDSTTLKFKAYRENGTLKIEILEGEDVIRATEDETQDLNITDASGTSPVVEIGVEDNQIFKIFKYTTDGETQEKIPLPGTKFVITDLNGEYVTDADGKTVGEWDETLQKNVVTTDENGQITANLREGLYKAVEVYVDEKYELSENEEDRTYYFGIDASVLPTYSWANAINGQGWDYVNSVEATTDGGVVVAGGFTEYSTDIVAGAQIGVDLNNDGIVEEVSKGSKDGIIVAYDKDGNYKWSKTVGGTDDDCLNKIIQTSDGGYAVVGYVSSDTVYFDGEEKDNLSGSFDHAFGKKDIVIIKLDKDGNYIWGARNGETRDEEAISVVETSEGNLAIVGYYTRSSFALWSGYGGAIGGRPPVVPPRPGESTPNINNKDGVFIIQYSMDGYTARWETQIASKSPIEVVDITDTADGIAIALNSINSGDNLSQDIVVLDKSRNIVSYPVAQGKSSQGIIFDFNFNNQTIDFCNIYGQSDNTATEISSIDIDSDNEIIMALESTENTNMIMDFIAFDQNGNKNQDQIDYGLNITGNNYHSQIVGIVKHSYYLTPFLACILYGNDDVYISDLKVTPESLNSHEGFLFGGWSYSSNAITIEGGITGNKQYNLSAVQGSGTSDGFVIKADGLGVTYSSRLYGDGYEGVKAVAETTNGNIVSGGYFNSSTLNASNYKFNDTGEVKDGIIIDNGRGNSNGFIVSEFTEGSTEPSSIPETQYLEIENNLKSFKITTEVVKHDESGAQVAGGNINGSEGTLEIEKVTYGENSTKEIKITPNAGYAVSSIKINGTEFTNYSTNADGTITLPILENVTEDKHITVEFSNAIGTIEINHYIWKDGQVTTEKVKDSETLTGNVGEEYTTLPATDIKYDIITNSDYYGASLPEGVNGDDYYIPDNYAGTFVAGQNEPVNYYYKYKEYTVTFNYYIEGTTQGVPNKNYTDGTTIQPDIQTITKDKTYTHNFSTTVANNIDTSIYELVGSYENYGLTEKDGQYVYEVNYDNLEADLEVIFYYRLKTADLSFTKVAEEDRTETIAGTEFTLFKKKDGSTVGDDELIKATNESSWQNDWEKVNTYTTQEDGKVNLVNLPINAEYRLVETKAATGRLIASGQWKIEFMHGEYDTSDEQIITVNGTDLKITAIGNPPALAIGEDGKLQLPNREIFNFPTSGSFGSQNIYQVGLIIMALGLVILLSRKFLLVGVGVKSSQRLRNRRRNKARHNKEGQERRTNINNTNIYKANIEEPSIDKSNMKKTSTRKSTTRRTGTKEIKAEKSDKKKSSTKSTSKTRAKKGKHSE